MYSIYTVFYTPLHLTIASQDVCNTNVGPGIQAAAKEASGSSAIKTINPYPERYSARLAWIYLAA